MDHHGLFDFLLWSDTGNDSDAFIVNKNLLSVDESRAILKTDRALAVILLHIVPY